MSKERNILIVNDDGVDAFPLHLLARLAKPYGNVTVVAPNRQCSAMSQHITVNGQLHVRRAHDFPVDVDAAYSVSGTPADCVKVALTQILKKNPDAIFSGINIGVNTGFDICYSGTVGAALEGAMQGVPSIAWSSQANGEFDTVEAYFDEIADALLKQPPDYGQVWNVNFPGCKRGDCKGILWDRTPAQAPHYGDNYVRTDLENGDFTLDCTPLMNEDAKEGDDLRAVMDGYISIGLHYNAVMKGIRRS